MGPLLMAVGRVKFYIVAVDYFTKWAEASLLATITEQQCRRFVWKQIVCRFGLPEHLITDNARQFEARPWVEFCKMYAIRHTTSFVAYPQANGQAENLIRTIMDGLKKCMLAFGTSWAENLPYIL